MNKYELKREQQIANQMAYLNRAKQEIGPKPTYTPEMNRFQIAGMERGITQMEEKVNSWEAQHKYDHDVLGDY